MARVVNKVLQWIDPMYRYRYIKDSDSFLFDKIQFHNHVDWDYTMRVNAKIVKNPDILKERDVEYRTPLHRIIEYWDETKETDSILDQFIRVFINYEAVLYAINICGETSVMIAVKRKHKY